MAQYNEGTVTLTNGSAAVVGSGTNWTSALEGKTFKRRGENTPYTVQTVTDATHLTLTTNYAGASGSGIYYEIYMDFTANRGLREVQKGEYDGFWAMTENMRDIDEEMHEHHWVIDTTLSTGTEKGGVWVANRSGKIKSAMAYRKTAGSSSSTIIDINIGGVSIFSTRPTIAYDDSDKKDAGTINTSANSFSEGDVISMDIDQVEGGSPAGLTVIIHLGR